MLLILQGPVRRELDLRRGSTCSNPCGISGGGLHRVFRSSGRMQPVSSVAVLASLLNQGEVTSKQTSTRRLQLKQPAHFWKMWILYQSLRGLLRLQLGLHGQFQEIFTAGQGLCSQAVHSLATRDFGQHTHNLMLRLLQAAIDSGCSFSAGDGLMLPCPGSHRICRTCPLEHWVTQPSRQP